MDDDFNTWISKLRNSSKNPLLIACEDGLLNFVKIMLSSNTYTLYCRDGRGDSPLLLASSRGHLDLVKWLLERGCSMDDFNHSQETALHVACREGQILVVKFFVSTNRANLEQRESKGMTPFLLAVSYGHELLAQYLLDVGSNVKARDAEANTALHLSVCSHLSLTKSLVSYGLNLLDKNDEGDTIVTIAIKSGRTKIVENLIDFVRPIEASLLDEPDGDGYTPVMLGVCEQNIEIVKYLVSAGASLKPKNFSGNTALTLACRYKNFEITQFLLNNKAYSLESQSSTHALGLLAGSFPSKWEEIKPLLGVRFTDDGNTVTPLMIASKAGNVSECVRILGCERHQPQSITENLDVTSNNQASSFTQSTEISSIPNNSSSSSESSSSSANTEQTAAIESSTGIDSSNSDHSSSNEVPIHCQACLNHYGRKGLLQLVNERDESQATAVIFASKSGSLEVVKLLVEHGCDFKTGDKYGKAPLDAASSFGHLEVVKYLISKGADLKSLDGDHNTILHGASFLGQSHVVDYLISMGVPVNSKSERGAMTSLIVASFANQIQVVKSLVEHGAEIDAENVDGRTALMFAAKDGNIEVVKFLLSRGASLQNHRDKELYSPLLLASYDGRLDIIQYLLLNGSSQLERNKYGDTPLLLAVLNGHLKCAQFLISQGASIQEQTYKGLTPFLLAAREGHVPIVRWLLKNGASMLDKNDAGHDAFQLATEKKNHHMVEFLQKYQAGLSISSELRII